MNEFVRDGSLGRRKKRRTTNPDIPSKRRKTSSMDEQTTTIKKYLKTDNLQKTDRPFHAVNILSFRVADLERFILQLETSPEDTDEDQCDASPREWNPPPEIINSSNGNDFLITDEHFNRTKRFLLKDFQNIKEECMNQDFKKHMLSLDEDKQKQQLERILIQSYNETNRNLKQSKAMIKQLESKINIRFASPVEPPTSEVKKKLDTCIDNLKHDPKKKKILNRIFYKKKKEKIIKRIKELFGSEYLESDEQLMYEKYKSTEKNNINCSTKKSHNLHNLPKNSFGFTITSQSSVGHIILEYPIPLENKTTNVNKKPILKEMNVSVNDNLNNNINIQVPVSSKQTEIETSSTTLEMTDQTVVNNLNFQNYGNSNVQKNDHSTNIIQINKNLLDINNSTELINSVLDNKNSENILLKPNSWENELPKLDHIIKYLKTNNYDGDVDSRTLEMEINVVDVNLKDVGISKNKWVDIVNTDENILIEIENIRSMGLEFGINRHRCMKKKLTFSNFFTIKKLATYLAKNRFVFKFNLLWSTFQSEMIGQLILSLVYAFIDMEMNVLYLSRSFIYVFCLFAEISSIPSVELKNTFDIFIDIIKKYFKYYDIGLWKNWFVSKEFLSICAVFKSIYINKSYLQTDLSYDEIVNADRYFTRAEHEKYIFIPGKHTSVMLGKKNIFEPTTNSDDLSISNDQKKSKCDEKVTIKELKNIQFGNIDVDIVDLTNGINNEVLSIRSLSLTNFDDVSSNTMNDHKNETSTNKNKCDNHVVIPDKIKSMNEDVINISSSSNSKTISMNFISKQMKKISNLDNLPNYATSESTKTLNYDILNKDVIRLNNSSFTRSNVKLMNVENNDIRVPITKNMELEDQPVEIPNLPKNKNNDVICVNNYFFYRCEYKPTNVANDPVQMSDTNNSKQRIILKASTKSKVSESIHAKNKKMTNHPVELSDSVNIKNNGIIQVDKSASTDNKVTNSENNSIKEQKSKIIERGNYIVEKPNSMKRKDIDLIKVNKSSSSISSEIKNAENTHTTKSVAKKIKPINYPMEMSDFTYRKNRDVLDINKSTIVKSMNAESNSIRKTKTKCIELDNPIFQKSSSTKSKNKDVLKIDKSSSSSHKIKSTNNESNSKKKTINITLEKHTVKNPDSFISKNKNILKINKSSSSSNKFKLKNYIKSNFIKEQKSKNITLNKHTIKKPNWLNKLVYSKNKDVLRIDKSPSSSNEVKSMYAECSSMNGPRTINIELENHAVQKPDSINSKNKDVLRIDKSLSSSNEVKSTDAECSTINKQKTINIELENHAVQKPDSINSKNKDVLRIDKSLSSSNEVKSTDAECSTINKQKTINIELENHTVKKPDSINSKNKDVLRIDKSSSSSNEVKSTDAECSTINKQKTINIELENHTVQKPDLINSKNKDVLRIDKSPSSSNEVKSMDAECSSINEPRTINIELENHPVQQPDLFNSKNKDVLRIDKSPSSSNEGQSTDAECSSINEPITINIELENHTVKKPDSINSKNKDVLRIDKSSSSSNEGQLTDAECCTINEPRTINIELENHTVQKPDSFNSKNIDVFLLNNVSSSLSEVTLMNAENNAVMEPILNNDTFLNQNNENISANNYKSKKKQLDNNCVETSNSIKSKNITEKVQSNLKISVRSEFSYSNSFNSEYFKIEKNLEPHNDINAETNSLRNENNLNQTNILKKLSMIQVNSPLANFTIKDKPQQLNITHDSSTTIHMSSSNNNTFYSSASNLQPIKENNHVSTALSTRSPFDVNTYYSNPMNTLNSFATSTQQVAMNNPLLVSNTQYSTNNLHNLPVIPSRVQSSKVRSSRVRSSRIPMNNQNSTSIIAQSSVSNSLQNTALNNQFPTNHPYAPSQNLPGTRSSRIPMNNQNLINMITQSSVTTNSIYTQNSTSINVQSSNSFSNHNVTNEFSNTTSINYYNSARSNNCITNDYDVLHGLPNTSFSHSNNTLLTSNPFSFPLITRVPYFQNGNSTEPQLNNISSTEASINNFLFQNNLNSQYNSYWNKPQSYMSHQQVENATVNMGLQSTDHNSQSQYMAENCTKNCSNCTNGRCCCNCCKK